jgi:hypothetical protein
LRRNCFSKHIIEGRIEEEIDVTVRQGRRSYQLLDDLKETGGFRELKEEELARTLWKTCFGRGYRPIVRQIME